MKRLQIAPPACVVAGAFTLLPSRLLGHTLWVEWLGVVLAPVRQAALSGA